jgi:N-terminal domain of (some) glycogen debranching enzymes
MTSDVEPEVQVDAAGATRATGPALLSSELEAAPEVPAEAREELLALKSGAAFVCARPDGDIRASRASGEGLYVQDTRHLSELRVTVGGRSPVLLSSVMES